MKTALLVIIVALALAVPAAVADYRPPLEPREPDWPVPWPPITIPAPPERVLPSDPGPIPLPPDPRVPTPPIHALAAGVAGGVVVPQSPVRICFPDGRCVVLHDNPPPPREPLRAEPREEEAKTAVVPAPNPVAQGFPDRFHVCGVTGVTIRLPALVRGEIAVREQFFMVFGWHGWAKEATREEYIRWYAWSQRVDPVSCR